jgi:hypothetical protein
VISFDEKRPESLCPRHGRGWVRRGRPEARHRGSYSRRQGNPLPRRCARRHADQLRIRPRPHRNGASTLALVQQIRPAYPKHIRIYWIQDGLSSHWTPPSAPTQTPTTSSWSPPLPTPASSTGSRGPSTRSTSSSARTPTTLDWDAFGHALAEHVTHRNRPPSARGERSKPPNAANAERPRPRPNPSSPPNRRRRFRCNITRGRTRRSKLRTSTPRRALRLSRRASRPGSNARRRRCRTSSSVAAPCGDSRGCLRNSMGCRHRRST